MITQFKRVVCLFILCLALLSAKTYALIPPGCQIDDTYSEPGAVARFYDYAVWDLTDYKDLRFLSGGYSFHTL